MLQISLRVNYTLSIDSTFFKHPIKYFYSLGIKLQQQPSLWLFQRWNPEAGRLSFAQRSEFIPLFTCSPAMQTSVTFSSRDSVRAIHHTAGPESSLISKSRSSKSNSIQVLDEMLNSIISSVSPAEKTAFVEAVANATSSRRGLEHMLIENIVECSQPSGSGSGSTEALPRSPLSANEVKRATAGGAEELARTILNPITTSHDHRTLIPNTDKLTCHLPVPNNDCSDDAMSVLRPRRQITVKHYSDATPSMHCHICCRSSKNIKVYACAKIKEAICRKVVCSRCFIDNNWIYTEGWECSHCRGICPVRSQCFTYGRSNLRRKLQASKRKYDNSQRSTVRLHPFSAKLMNKNFTSDQTGSFLPQISLTKNVLGFANGEREEGTP